jgi:hypothetical protein
MLPPSMYRESNLTCPNCAHSFHAISSNRIDRFYLGYIISSLLKLATAGGLGIWYIIDIILICIGALPDHNGCSLIAP